MHKSARGLNTYIYTYTYKYIQLYSRFIFPGFIGFKYICLFGEGSGGTTRTSIFIERGRIKIISKPLMMPYIDGVKVYIYCTARHFYEKFPFINSGVQSASGLKSIELGFFILCIYVIHLGSGVGRGKTISINNIDTFIMFLRC